MKNLIKSFSLPVIFLFCFMSPLFLYGQEENKSESVQQRFIPETFFIGDKVELQYSFDSPVDFFSGLDISLFKENRLPLSKNFISFFSADSKFEILSASISRSDMTYTLYISFIPWTAGVIEFPDFDINRLIEFSYKRKLEDEEKKFTSAYMVSIRPVTVESVSERLEALSIRPPVAPQVLPGTNYIVWSLIALALFLFFAIVFVLARFSHIVEAFLMFGEKLELLKNSKAAGRKLKRLLKKKCSDADFAEAWQVIVKNYLNSRFAASFASVTTGRLYSVISNISGDLISDEQESAVLTLVSLFTRTDYIRFAANSIDSRMEPAEEHLAAFSQGERKSLIEWTLDSIRGLE